jgi:opacity protein-like surface antigen
MEQGMPETETHRTDPNRRKFLFAAAGAAAAPMVAATSLPANAQGAQGVGNSGQGSGGATVRDRRKLGSLEVSSVGLGVQNMHRTYQTTIPSRPEMLNIIRGLRAA